MACFAAFWPAIDGEFVYWDDDTNLMFNTHIREFSAESLKWMWTSSLLGVWQPLTWFITAIQYRLFGPDLQSLATGMHMVSILLHAIAAMLVLAVSRQLITAAAPESAIRNPVALTLGATLAALIFAVHPLRCEIVAWASGQPYILAMIPTLGCVWCYLKAQQTSHRRWHMASLACLVTALLCKSIAVPLVAVLLVLDVYPLRRLGGPAGWSWPAVGRVLVEKLPYAAITAVAVALTIWATWTTKQYTPDPLFRKLLVAAWCMMFYVVVTVVPYGLSPYYMRPGDAVIFGPTFYAAALVFVGLTVLLIVLRRRYPYLLAAWCAYVIVLLPVVGLIKHGGQMAADRYAYLSCIGWAIIAGAVFMRAWSAQIAPRATSRALAAALASVILVGAVVATRAYCQAWDNSVAIFTAMVERNPQFWMGYYNLAKAQKRPCRAWEQAAASAQKAGNAERAQQLREQAAHAYAAAAASYEKAIELYPLYPEANVDFGNMIRFGQAPGGPSAAMQRYQTALRGRPGFHMAHLNIAHLLMAQRDYAGAVRHLELAEADAIRARQAHRLPSIRTGLKRARAELEGESSTSTPESETESDS